MKLTASCLSLVLTFLMCLPAQATPKSFEESEAFEVTVGSQSLALIEQAVESIFNSGMKDTLCNVYGNYISFASSVGITLQKSRQLMSTCPKNSYHELLTKIFSKRYFLIFSNEAPKEIESWTTEDNRTYLWVHPGLTSQELKNLIAHEIAMSVDGKMGMYLSTYFTYERLHSKDLPNSTVLVTIPSQLDPIEARLKVAFHGASYMPINYALAAMRAYNFERYVPSRRLSI